jgi:hypothetical protein
VRSCDRAGAQDNAEALPLLQKLHAAHPQDAAITRMLADVLADAGDGGLR